jgi:hypothetical protein
VIKIGCAIEAVLGFPPLVMSFTLNIGSVSEIVLHDEYRPCFPDTMSFIFLEDCFGEPDSLRTRP